MKKHLTKSYLYIYWFYFLFNLNMQVFGAAINNLPTVILTVDVESIPEIPIIKQFDPVLKEGSENGLQRMVKILKENNFSATFFFLNVYESKKWGEEPIKKLTKWLIKMGQDVQLHPHPHWAYDERRPFLYQYSLDEQVKIIRDGKEMLESWSGKPVVAHRAGAYSADKNTLEALIKNDIFFDSSFFWGNENSKITSLNLGKNVVSKYGPLIEFPVTIYMRHDYTMLLGERQLLSVIRKYDINWFRDSLEAELAMVAAIDSGLDYIMIFLHSFSFFETQENNGEVRVDQNAIDIFIHVLDFISKRNIKVMTFSDLSQGEFNFEGSMGSADIIPEVKVEIGMIKFLIKAALTHKVDVALIGGFILSLSICCIVLIFRFRKHSKRPLQKSETYN